MNASPIKPKKALNKAFLKVKPTRNGIETFKANLIKLLDSIDENESEEFNKNLLARFLTDTYFKDTHFINTKGRNDLVVHNGAKSSSSVGVIIEAKAPGTKPEMVTKEKLNKKALQELLLYYLRERITGKNLELKNLIVTNVHEWFIFDAQVFERLFAQNKKLVKRFEDFEQKVLSGTKTDFFYKEIAKAFLDQLEDEIEFTYFDIRDYEKALRNEDKKDDIKLISLYKLLSPTHLLKLPFANDSNSLDKNFYVELLHIIGLKDVKVKGKRLIRRKDKGERDRASLIENVMIQVDSKDKLSRIHKVSRFGADKEEQLFNVALELVITWMNRILFLKLLEAQLVAYHKGDKEYRFLTTEKIKDFDDMGKLFFRVLARKVEDRSEFINNTFGRVPYLNSSLFEPTDLEHDTIDISGLEDNLPLDIHAKTVLKMPGGKRKTGNLNTLEYLFDFLDAYDFSSEGAEEIQEENKTLITASVLGLIFEKINGYKDGSFFTPGFITMYMCRESIRRAVTQKFREQASDKIDSFEDVKAYCTSDFKAAHKLQCNAVIDDLKICDPAVGSGHFLVSALNEIIAIKSELGILIDDTGNRLPLEATVENDELILADPQGQIYSYLPTDSTSQRIQQSLFKEKQKIIEGCLFGVDINPNSVKICRLRLWIELLKNAYYKQDGQLETLPNIDINIKCGNSLVSRFALDADISKALKKSKWNIDTYRIAVQSYRAAKDKDSKREFLKLIDSIKSDFESEISRNDPRLKKLAKKSAELNDILAPQLFEPTAKEKKAIDKKKKALVADVKKLQDQIDQIKDNKIFENGFEWRFEFPEVLDDDGNFVGFDVVIGNPPYIRQEELKDLKSHFQNTFSSYSGTADLFVYFVEQGISCLTSGGQMSFIIPNKWMRAGYGKPLRKYLLGLRIEKIIDFGDLDVFEEATTYPSIIFLSRSLPKSFFSASNIMTLDFPEGIAAHVRRTQLKVIVDQLGDTSWALLDETVQSLLRKMRAHGTPLVKYIDGKIFYGIKTGLNEAFVIDQRTRDHIIDKNPDSLELIKPFLGGRDIKRYLKLSSNKYLILFKSGQTKMELGQVTEAEAWTKLQLKHPEITSHLSSYEAKARKRYDQGDFWWEMRPCDYYDRFEGPKIIIPAIVKTASYTIDSAQLYGNDKTSIIPGADMHLLGLLNSKLLDFYLHQIASTKQNGYFEYKPVYVSQLPIVGASNESKIADRVKEILAKKAADETNDTSILEVEIDQLVYELYQLTPEEIKIVQAHENR